MTRHHGFRLASLMSFDFVVDVVCDFFRDHPGFDNPHDVPELPECIARHVLTAAHHLHNLDGGSPSVNSLPVSLGLLLR